MTTTISNRAADRGLYVPASEGYSIVSHVDGGNVVGRDASHMPLILWPSGHWCFPANAFMLHLVDRGLSRFNRGGTLGTYAAHLAPLLRYCAMNGVDFPELSDSHFTLFVNGLKAARYQPGSLAPKLEPSGVITLASTCLTFLQFVGELYGVPLVGPNAAIRANLVEGGRRDRRASRKWQHHSFPTASPVRKRLPASSEAISKLRIAAAQHSPTPYVLRRRQIMLSLLEITGARRSEIAALTTKSVERAAAMDAPRLELVTRKGRGKKRARFREVPITKASARLLMEFLRTSRAVVIRRTCGTSADDGALLVNAATGRSLRPNTITQEVAFLARAASLETLICAHMFRHRYITNVFKALVEEHHAESEDSFRKLLLSTEELKTRVCEWTGHSDISSLSDYIHLAFEEVGGVQVAVDAVHAKLAIKEFVSGLNALDFSTMSRADFEKLKQAARDLTAELASDKPGRDRGNAGNSEA